MNMYIHTYIKINSTEPVSALIVSKYGTCFEFLNTNDFKIHILKAKQ